MNYAGYGASQYLRGAEQERILQEHIEKKK